MEKLREMAVKLACQNSTIPLTASQISIIEQRLLQYFSDSHTPTHRPYSSMIIEAIQGLNEGGGSAKDSISGYIRAHYDDLPWAHESYLSHHLDIMCEKGTIMVGPDGRYLILGSENVYKRRQPKRKLGSGHVIEVDLTKFGLIEDDKDVESKKSTMTEKSKSIQWRQSLVLNGEDQLIKSRLCGVEGQHAAGQCEFQLTENWGLHKKQEDEVCVGENSFNEHCVERSHGKEVLSQDQPNKVIAELGDHGEIKRVDKGRKTRYQQKLIKWSDNQNQSTCQEKARTDTINHGNESSGSESVVAPERTNFSKTRLKSKGKEMVKKKKEDVLVFGLATECLEKQKPRRKITRLDQGLAKQVQEVAKSAPDSSPSPEYPEHDNKQEKSDELSMPIIGFKTKKSPSCKEGTKHVNKKERMWPTWVQPLVQFQSYFFGPCDVHKKSREGKEVKCHLYCSRCSVPFCQLCVGEHDDHPFIRVRRGGNKDEVIDVKEVEKLLDISGSETHVYLDRKVLALSRKPAAKRPKGCTKACVFCERPLPEAFRFCSFRCKDLVMVKAS